MSVCDVCSRPTDFANGYALTTESVVTNPEYWKLQIDQHGLDDEILLMYVQQQSMQRSGWLVCEACSTLFSFDRSRARKAAASQTDPPGSGPADVNRTAAAAARAWQQKKGQLPSWAK